jgi:hypothetical protein
VPQPTALPRAPILMGEHKKQKWIICITCDRYTEAINKNVEYKDKESDGL